MSLVMSVLVMVSGLVIALALDASPPMQIFGYVLALIGGLGLVGTLLVRRRTRG